MRKHSAILTLTLAALLLLSACAQKNYDTIGAMTLRDESILTPAEAETLAELRAEKERLVGAKDEAGIEALKAEWDAFRTPIDAFIDEYNAAKRTFFSGSERDLLTQEEASEAAAYEARLSAAYKSRDDAELKAVAAEWETWSAPLRETLDAYRGISRPGFSESEKSLLTNDELAQMEDLQSRTETALEERDASTLKSLKNEWSAFASRTARVKKNYVTLSNFSIEGKWKNVGKNTFGQVQEGAIVIFDGKNCNFYSPMDTYAFYKDGDAYTLECTSFLFAETLTFTVKLVDKDNIDVFTGWQILELRRVE